MGVSFMRIVILALSAASRSSPAFSFLRPHTCVFSPLHHAWTTKTRITEREAATIAGGGGLLEGESEKEAQRSNVVETTPSRKAWAPSLQQVLVTPGVNPSRVIQGVPKEATTAAAVAGEVASPIETKGDRVASTAPLGHGAKASPYQTGSRPNWKEKPSGVPRTEVAEQATPAVPFETPETETVSARSEAEIVVGATVVVAAQGDTTAAGDESIKKKKRGLSATPETTAAEKVLTLVDIGLVDKAEAAAYYEALSDLERTTKEAKAAAVAAATTASVNPQSPSSSTVFTSQDEPLSLVPFPALCAALGAAGTHSLQLTGGLGAALSIFGAVTGVALGSVVVSGDDPIARVARSTGSAVTWSASTAGRAAGRSVSESVSGAAGAAVGAVEEAIVQAPSNFVAGLGTAISSALAAAVGVVVALPGELTARAVDGAKGALHETSEAVVKIPGKALRKATQAAEGALQSTSKNALNAVKESPREAAKRLKEAVSSNPRVDLTALVKDASSAGAENRKKRDKVQPASASGSPASFGPDLRPAAQSMEFQEPGGIPVEELEAKMLSVQKALQRFDVVKNRIEEAQTSDTLLRMVGMARRVGASAEAQKSDKTGATTSKAKKTQVASEELTFSRSSFNPERKPKSRVAPSEQRVIDQSRRKDVAEQLLEKASQRAMEAKAGLKADASSSRRNDDYSKATTSSEQNAPQATTASM